MVISLTKSTRAKFQTIGPRAVAAQCDATGGPVAIGDGGRWTVSFQLNEALVTRIYEATKDIRLPVSDSASKQERS